MILVVMGNSQANNVSQRASVETEQKWAHSFPRNPPPRTHQHKVLPERDLHQKLRPTNNGEILNSGGTLSGRHQQRLPFENVDRKIGIFRSSSISSNRPNEYQKDRSTSPPNRSYLAHQRDPLHKSGHKFGHFEQKNTRVAYNYRKEQMKRFDSEPDLRDSVSRNTLDCQDKFSGKKKYKAPPPPPMGPMGEKPEQWDQTSNGGYESRARRARLFKTRAETKKKSSSPLCNRRYPEIDFSPSKLPKSKAAHRSIENIYDDENNPTQLRERDKNQDSRMNRLSLPEMIRTHSMPNFQAELLEATKRMKSSKHSRELEDNKSSSKYKKEIDSGHKEMKEKLKTLDHNINKKDNIRQKLKQMEIEENIRMSLPIDGSRGQASGKESTPEPSPPRMIHKEKHMPAKTFYFGMDDPVDKPIQSFTNLVDHFAATLAPHNLLPPNSSGSDISSELDMDESQISTNGIALQLRPILPKKQLEIPRFSPAAAWKLLSSVENNAPSSTVPSDEGPVFIEDRIEKLSRPPPPPSMQIGPRSSHDKSGDSGISGDAGPPGYDETPEPVVISPRKIPITISQECTRQHGISWTPQQDLGDDSSLEEGLNSEKPVFNSTPRFSPRPHVFSLSLPRENHLAVFMGEKGSAQAYTGLQKIKRSVSGVLGTLANKKDIFQVTTTQEQSDNWFFSRSAPNSLNNGFNSLEMRRSQKSDDQEQSSLVPSNNQPNGGRLMYLPNLDYTKNQRQSRSEARINYNDRSKSADRFKTSYKLSLLSKSCENVAAEAKLSSEPEDLQDPPKASEEKWEGRKPKRFTFQSTVRQIERKRLAEKLSKEAERKEMQRLRELEAMQKVEEEFQRKRAREKATIRQQLRLFSMDETVCLPVNPDIKKEVAVRSEPDGAVSSATSSPTLPIEEFNSTRKSEVHLRPYASSSDSSEDNKLKATVTQVLSEYKQPSRDYKEFRGNVRYLNENNDAKTTVHPQVTCKMPKASNYQASNNVGFSVNYRKDFAHGVKKSGGSVYSDDSQTNNKNHSSMVYNNKNAPVTRF